MDDKKLESRVRESMRQLFMELRIYPSLDGEERILAMLTSLYRAGHHDGLVDATRRETPKEETNQCQ